MKKPKRKETDAERDRRLRKAELKNPPKYRAIQERQ